MVQRSLSIPMNTEVIISLDPVITTADDDIKGVSKVRNFKFCLLTNCYLLTIKAYYYKF